MRTWSSFSSTLAPIPISSIRPDCSRPFVRASQNGHAESPRRLRQSRPCRQGERTNAALSWGLMMDTRRYCEAFPRRWRRPLPPSSIGREKRRCIDPPRTAYAEVVKHLLDACADFNLADAKGFHPLHWAMTGDEEVASQWTTIERPSVVD